MKIKHILEIFQSKLNRNGNTEWAIRYTSAITGRSAEMTVDGGEDNCRSVILELNGGEWGNNYHSTVRCLPAREFNRLTKDWPLGGCLSKSLADEIKKQLREQTKAEKV